MKTTRRNLLRIGVSSLSAFGAFTTIGKLGQISALAAPPVFPPNYRALVCIYLGGGNDGHNMVIPVNTNTQEYTDYAASRLGLALPANSLITINNGSEQYGLPNNMPEMAALYGMKQAAILANVGMLVQPIDKPTFNMYPNGSPIIPVNLFSHSDQSNQWQTVAPNGISSTGWGGRVADYMQTHGVNTGNQYPPVVNNGGCGPFCTGSLNLPGVVPTSGPAGLSGTLNDMARITGMTSVLSFDNGLKLVQAANDVSNRGIAQGVLLNNALSSAPKLTTQFPANNPLAAQLNMVAQIIAVQSQLSLTKQIFFCNLGGFDTHGAQAATQVPLLQQLSQAINAFYAATVELTCQSQVTTFTTSEFGRTVMPNGNAGTDHAWGNHHFVVGGAVQGSQFYGQYPLMALGNNNPLDVTGRGSLIPTTSVDQYAATLAQWFGVAPGADMQSILPNIVNFQTQNLGFLG
jgi:uncharacterized protein (DUF1501 family)